MLNPVLNRELGSAQRIGDFAKSLYGEGIGVWLNDKMVGISTRVPTSGSKSYNFVMSGVLPDIHAPNANFESDLLDAIATQISIPVRLRGVRTNSMDIASRAKEQVEAAHITSHGLEASYDAMKDEIIIRWPVLAPDLESYELLFDQNFFIPV